MNYQELIRDSEMLYAAVSNKTRRYYLTDEDGLCAVIFPEQADLDRYALRKKEEGIRVDAREDPKENRDHLLLDFWRYGISKVRIECKEPAVLPLSALFTPPDYSEVPLENRPVPDPELTGAIFWLLQNTADGTADAALVRSTMERIRKAKFFGPAIEHPDGSLGLPIIRQDGKRLSLLFTDTREYVLSFEDKGITMKRFDASDIVWLLQHNSDAVAINIGSGLPLLIDKELITASI